MVEILIRLFSIILDTGKISENWKKSDTIILHKKGDRHEIENYRLIIPIPHYLRYFLKQ